ncbi:hypothetical protein ACFFX0_14995 [Citricoccus parietis]|uniref:Uncharacterized protein n=1 Tax=Citricoccus parietis TaxID=592307 RepID=A0ABV5G0J8_9MICC
MPGCAPIDLAPPAVKTRDIPERSPRHGQTPQRRRHETIDHPRHRRGPRISPGQSRRTKEPRQVRQERAELLERPEDPGPGAEGHPEGHQCRQGPGPRDGGQGGWPGGQGHGRPEGQGAEPGGEGGQGQRRRPLGHREGGQRRPGAGGQGLRCRRQVRRQARLR